MILDDAVVASDNTKDVSGVGAVGSHMVRADLVRNQSKQIRLFDEEVESGLVKSLNRVRGVDGVAERPRCAIVCHKKTS